MTADLILEVGQRVLGNLSSRRDPHVGMAGDVFKGLLKGAQTMRATDLIVVGRNTHHRPTLGALLVELVEGAANDLSIATRLHLLHYIGNSVIEFQRVRYRHKRLTTAGFNPGRLIIVEQIAGVEPTGLGK